VGLETFTVASKEKLQPGKHTLKFDFAYEGGRGGGGIGSIYVDDKKIAEGKIGKTNSNTFGIDESADVGVDENTPVYPPYRGKEKFTGKINSVTIETKPAQ
jgi:arylsulfatase